MNAKELVRIPKDWLLHCLDFVNHSSISLQIKEIAELAIEKVSQVLGAQRISIMLCEEDTLTILAAKGISEDIIKTTKVRLGEWIAGWVAKRKKPLLVKDVTMHPYIQKKEYGEYKTKSFISVPLERKEKVLGVMNVTERENCFDEEELYFLSMLGNYIAMAIENVKIYQEASQLAITDPLTKLFNTRYFHQHLTEEIKRAQRYGRPLSLIMFDIDHFKYYNDQHGHLAGDRVLSEIASLMQQNTREVDIVARYGGEEFVIILPETELFGAKVIAEKIRRVIQDFKFLGEETQPGGRLTISGGVVIYEKDIKTKEELIQRADLALYQAKKEGRNRVFVYSPTKEILKIPQFEYQTIYCADKIRHI